MPARIVVVHDDAELLERLVPALRDASYDVAPFTDPIVAMDALDAATTVELLITRIQFGVGKPHGISLAMMAKRRRPGIRVIFTALPEFETYAKEVGVFLPLPVNVPALVEVVDGLLSKRPLEV